MTVEGDEDADELTADVDDIKRLQLVDGRYSRQQHVVKQLLS